MVRFLFIIVYWAAFFFLKHFLTKYELPINDKIYTWAGIGFFLLLAAFYSVLQAFFRAYLGVHKPAPREKSFQKPEPDPPQEKKKSRPPEKAGKKPEKKSRIRVLGTSGKIERPK